MSTSVAFDDPFSQLLAGVSEFRARVEGTSQRELRQRVLRLEGQDGLIPKVTRLVLESLRDMLVWLHQALDDEGFLLPLDAILVVIELLGQGLATLGKTLPTTSPGEFAPITAGLATLGSRIDAISRVELPASIPSPATLAAIQVETRALLGQRVDPDPNTPIGSLDELLSSLT